MREHGGNGKLKIALIFLLCGLICSCLGLVPLVAALLGVH